MSYGSKSGQPFRPEPVKKTDEIPVDAFNPLLRSLLSWHLVNRVELEDGTHRWELTESAQERLDHLNPASRKAAKSLAYLDHWCARCRQQRLTHLRDGRYICVDCEAAEARGTAPELESTRHRPVKEELAGLAKRRKLSRP